MTYESERSLKLYMSEISTTPLLSAQEELDLSGRIQMGDPEARSHMIRANLRLVVKIAQDYVNYGLPLTDLISEGNLGLMKAVERFDPDKGVRFSTYAAAWIKQSIRLALANQSNTIRLPVHVGDKIARMRRIATLLTEAMGREPTDEELADELGLPRYKLAMLRQAAHRQTSLDAPIIEGEDTAYGEVIRDERAIHPVDMLADKDRHTEIAGLLAVLNQRERRIIDAHFGLGGRVALTLEELGRDFGLSCGRIRQLQNSALDKMRRSLSKKPKPRPMSLRNTLVQA
ncbi:MAG: RNA polymerase sigma factor RpoD/SigA [Verrucomicrobia bacterium]|nr:RNA polymerase sigma factor RpoD/SigA [Verrucomicrobiota bacterium]